MDQHIFIPPPSLREKAPSIPSAVEAAVMKALSKDPEQRFASVQEFANALEAAASASVTQPAAQAPAHIPSPQPHTAPARLQVLLVTLALLMLGGGSLAYYLLALRPVTSPAALSREQLLYLQVTGGTPAIDDPLRTDDSLGWNAQNECTFTGGALHIRNNSAGGGCLPLFVTVSDFAYQVQATIIKGNVAALFFRNALSLSNTTAYFFYITSDGTYSLFQGKRSTLGSFALVKFQRSPTIKTGLNQPNLLTVIACGSNIYLYINTQYVAHVVNSSSETGDIGVIGSTTSPNSKEPVDVAFRNFQVWYL